MEKYFATCKKSAFRLELRQEYADDKKQANLFSKTGTFDIATHQKWLKILRSAQKRGCTFSRVHVVSYPLSSYIEYEMKAYSYSSKAGEKIHLLDKKNYISSITHDFWLFDDCIVLKMNYSQNGQFLGYEKITKNIDKYIELKRTLLHHSERYPVQQVTFNS